MSLHHRIYKNTPYGVFLLLSQGVFARTRGYILPIGDQDKTLVVNDVLYLEVSNPHVWQSLHHRFRIFPVLLSSNKMSRPEEQKNDSFSG